MGKMIESAVAATPLLRVEIMGAANMRNSCQKITNFSPVAKMPSVFTKCGSGMYQYLSHFFRP